MSHKRNNKVPRRRCFKVLAPLHWHATPISEMTTQDGYSTMSIHFSFHGCHYDPTLNVLYSDGVFHNVI